VLLNLLSNAVKFTEEGEVVVHVDAEPAGAGSHRVRLVVRDTGIGIPPDRMDRLFAVLQPGRRLDDAPLRGTGLGLAISKRLVELMGGTLSVESEEGKGSAFHIEFDGRGGEVRRGSPATGRPARGQAPARRRRQRDEPRDRDPPGALVGDGGRRRRAPSEALALLEAGEPFDVAVLDMSCRRWTGSSSRTRSDAVATRDAPAPLAHVARRLPRARASREFAAQLAKPIKASQLFNALLGYSHQVEPRAAESAPEGDEPRGRRRCGSSSRRTTRSTRRSRWHSSHRLGFRADVAWNGLEASRRSSDGRTTSSSWTSRCRSSTASTRRAGSASVGRPSPGPASSR
jgi:anti-sigma regulatory factor (Ser/Thr protein kinase)